MRVLLIKPETVGIFAYTNLVDHEPLELEYLYTVLKNRGHEAYIYDRRHELTPLKSKLKHFAPDIVCITGYIAQEKLMIKLTHRIKRFDPKIIVTIGGSHAELNYANFFDSPADYIYHLSGLDSYNKKATLEHNEECIKILEELNIICAGLFIVHQDMTVKDFKELYKWIAQRAIIPTISIFTPMQGSADFAKYKNNLLSTDSRKQDLFHCILKPKHMSVLRFTYEYYKLSIKLAWHKRKTPLYSCINTGSFFFIIKVFLVKLRRVFII